MPLLPPLPIGVPPGHDYWNDWYEKLRRYIAAAGTIVYSSLDFTGGNITSIPTRDHGAMQDLLADDHTQYQLRTEENAVSGYAGLNASSRITKGADITDDLIVDVATKGLVLKDTQGTPHYWRITISNVGAIVITDLGTTKP